MLINSIDYKIKEYDILTNYSFKLKEIGNGKFILSDRGAACDYYISTITMHSTKDILDSLQVYLELQRSTSDTITVNFSSSGEKPFGASIDYSGAYSVYVLDIGKVLQKTFKGYSLTISLQLITPIFLGSATLPDLKYSSFKFDANAEYTKITNTSYTNDALPIENNCDYGTFKGTFYFNDSNMANLERYVADKRGLPFYLNDISGLEYIFSKRKKIKFPVRVRILELDYKYKSPDRWECKLELIEEV